MDTHRPPLAHISLMADSGAGFVDHTQADTPTSWYQDSLHLNGRGRTWMTRALAEGLLEIDALGTVALAQVPRALLEPPRITTTGVLPEDGRIQRGGEDANWVAPGETLTVTLPDSWPSTATTVTATVSAHGKARGSPVLSMGDERIRLTGRRVLRAATLEGTSKTITLAIPGNGPLTLIHRLEIDGNPVIQLDEARDLLKKRADTAEGAALSPMPVEPRITDGLATVALGPLSVVENDRIFNAIGERLCSPVRILEDGESLSDSSSACRVVTRDATPGSFCVRKERALFRSQTAAPAAHTYALALDPARACMGHRWLYPGDTLTLSNLRSLHRGGSTLRLQGAMLSDEAWRVQVTLKGRSLLDRTLSADDLSEDGTLTLLLREPIPPRPRGLEITVMSEGFLALSGAFLGDERLPAATAATTHQTNLTATAPAVHPPGDR